MRLKNGGKNQWQKAMGSCYGLIFPVDIKEYGSNCCIPHTVIPSHKIDHRDNILRENIFAQQPRTDI
jgi:hypothetical protein